MVLQIELTNICNFNCIYCPRPFLNRKLQYMSKEVYGQILSMFIKQATTVILNKDGEPLLHPNFKELFLELTSIYTGKVDIYTNGTFLNKDIVDSMGNCNNEVHLLVTEHPLSREGVQDTTQVRFKLEEAVRRNFKNIKFHITIHNPNNIDYSDWKNHWEYLKEDYPNIMSIHINSDINPWVGFIDNKVENRFKNCPFIEYDSIFFGVTGNCLPCCIDLNEEASLGNVLIEEKEYLVNKLTLLRNKIKNKEYSTISPCNRCLQ